MYVSGGSEPDAFPVGLEDLGGCVLDVLESLVAAQLAQGAALVALDQEEPVEAVLAAPFDAASDLLLAQAAVALHTQVLVELVETPAKTCFDIRQRSS